MLKWTKNKEDKWNSSGKKLMEMARVDPHTPVFVTILTHFRSSQRNFEVIVGKRRKFSIRRHKAT